MATVFISYSHKDKEWKDRLEPHFKALEIEGFYQSWDDTQIKPGSDWRREIETALNQAHEIDRVLAAVAQTVCDCLGNIKKTALLPGDNVSLYKLPVTGDRLFGREKELQLLDDAWTEPQTAVLGLVAWGGVGKTSLVNQWLNQMKTADFRGAQKVFGWSFYSLTCYNKWR